jgi:hypothetical protein
MSSKITLVTFSTPTFWLRQQFLNLSAITAGVVHKTEQWNLARLAASSFHHENPHISLKERGVGFWSWKPYIIEQALQNVGDDDLVCYSDVGRMQVLLLRSNLDPFIEWMDNEDQDCIPGVHAPWYGPLSKWVRTDTLDAFQCNNPRFYRAPQMQASFSIWRKTPETMAFVSEWKTCCFNRILVSDDPNPSGQENFPDFITQQADQTMLSLLTLKNGLKGLKWSGEEIPPFVQKSPEDWLLHLGGQIHNGPLTSPLTIASKLYLSAEELIRRRKIT